MRSWLAIMAGALALVTAMPASAQESGFPTWLVGNWCTTLSQQVTACVWYEPPANGEMRSHHRMTRDGTELQRSDSVSTIEDGLVVKRSGGTLFVEVSRDENELVLENRVAANVAAGDARRITFRVDGDTLIVIFEFENEPAHRQRYVRTPRDPAD